jgi:hypothetical protein
MSVATIVLGLAGLAVALAPLVGKVGLGLGPFVALCGGGIGVAGLVLGLATLVLGRKPRRARPLWAGLLIGTAAVVTSLAVERALVRRELADEARAAGPVDHEAQRKQDVQFDRDFQDNLNK